MRIISHRGCLDGPDPLIENNPNQIDHAIQHTLDVEIDLWMVHENLFLGHDDPHYPVTIDWLNERSDKLWVHCKNIKALEYLSLHKSNLNYFFHQTDHVTLTSKNFLWVYPKMEFTENSVIVAIDQCDLKKLKDSKIQPMAICTDYPLSML
jgi:hypothetical protein